MICYFETLRKLHIHPEIIALTARLDHETNGGIATKAAMRRAIVAAGIRPRAQTVQAAWNTLEAIRQVRRTRAADRARRRPNGRAPVLLPAGTPTERLNARRVVVASRYLVSSLRIGRNDSFEVRLTDDPAAVGLTQAETVSYPYKGQFKGWACRARAWVITVPRQYRVRVVARSLTDPDGLATLDASLLDGAPAGTELFAAIWITQGRGTAATTTRGYIARDVSSRATYHAATADAALVGLRRKARAAAWAATLRTGNVAELVRGHESLPVSLADARAVGACEYGIRAWAAAVGLDYARGGATLGEIATGYAARPAPEARAVILRVLRRARALRLAA